MSSTQLVAAFLAVSLVACSDDNDSMSTQSTESELPADAKIAPWGFDLTGMDPAVVAGDSFYAFANGTWTATHEIPADRVAWGPFDELALETGDQVQTLVDSLEQRKIKAASGDGHFAK